MYIRGCYILIPYQTAINEAKRGSFDTQTITNQHIIKLNSLA
jgi:hypothetical protein